MIHKPKLKGTVRGVPHYKGGRVKVDIFANSKKMLCPDFFGVTGYACKTWDKQDKQGDKWQVIYFFGMALAFTQNRCIFRVYPVITS